MKKISISNNIISEMCDAGLSIEAMGRAIGVSGQTITRRLKEFNLMKIEYSTYKNKEWLYWQYHMLKKTQKEIADNMNKPVSVIARSMRNLGVKTRDRAEVSHMALGNSVAITKDVEDMINGGAIGDGYIGSGSNFSAYYSQTNKHKAFTEWLASEFYDLGIDGNIYRVEQERWGKINTAYTFCSLNYSELLAFRNIWYPNGKKIVPDGLEVNPRMMLFWYLGDGYLSSSGKTRPIGLCTNGFSDDGVDLLVKKLSNIGVYSRRQPARNTIYINSTNALIFLDIIGKCPDEIWKCMGYKWDLDRLKYEWEAEFCQTAA